jgi:hypothetical protein
VAELDGFFVEFRGDGTIVDTMIFHQPNGVFVANRIDRREQDAAVIPAE